MTNQRTQEDPKQINHSLSPCHSQDQIKFQAFMSLAILKYIFACFKIEVVTEVSITVTYIQAGTSLSIELVCDSW